MRKMRGTRESVQASEHVVVQHTSAAVDKRLLYAVFGMLILILIVVLYGVIVGVVSPIPARTATEARIKILESAVLNNSTSGKAHFDYVTGLAAAGNMGDAYKAVDRARAVLTDWDGAYADAAEVALLFQDEKYEEAMEVARAGYERDMKAREAWVEQKRQENVTVAVTDIDPEPLITMLIFEGRASGATEDWERAVDAFTEALALSPQSADILVLRGTAYENAGDTALALADFESALTYIPDFQAALDGIERVRGGE